MATRLFARQSQTEPTTGGTVYDLGTTADTGTLAITGTANTLTEHGRFVRQLTAGELPSSGTISVPYQVSIASQSTNAESRIVIARCNSAGTIQESFLGATYTGTAATTLSGTASLSGFVITDLVAIIVENRRTSGGGSRTTTVNTTTASYVDVPLVTAGQGENLSATSTAGAASGEAPAAIPAGQGENLTATSTAGAASGEAPAPPPAGQGENLSVTSTAGAASGGDTPPPPPYTPSPQVIMNGVNYTSDTVGSVSVRRGRDTVYAQVQAGYATVELVDVAGLRQPQVGEMLTVTVLDSDAVRVPIFTGQVSDWSGEAQPVHDGVLVRYRVQAVGPIARLNRRTVLFGGRAVELDGARVAAAVGAGLSSSWEEVAGGVTWADADVSWVAFDPGFDAALIDAGVFDVAALDVSDGGYQALSAAQDAAQSAEGVLFETADGKIGYADSDRRYAAAVADEFVDLPFGAVSASGVEVSQQFADVTNRVTVEFAGGVVTDTFDESVQVFGEVLGSRLSTILADVSAANQKATLFLERHGERSRQLGRLPFNMRGVTATVRQALLGLNTGSPVTLTGVDESLGFTHFSGFVEGVDFTVDEFRFEIGLLVSDEGLSTGAVRWSLVPGSVSWDDVGVALTWSDARVV